MRMIQSSWVEIARRMWLIFALSLLGACGRADPPPSVDYEVVGEVSYDRVANFRFIGGILDVDADSLRLALCERDYTDVDVAALIDRNRNRPTFTFSRAAEESTDEAMFLQIDGIDVSMTLVHDLVDPAGQRSCISKIVVGGPFAGYFDPHSPDPTDLYRS